MSREYSHQRLHWYSWSQKLIGKIPNHKENLMSSEPAKKTFNETKTKNKIF